MNRIARYFTFDDLVQADDEAIRTLMTRIYSTSTYGTRWPSISAGRRAGYVALVCR
jgi:hypothetical protein